MVKIPGYALGSTELPPAPISIAELAEIKTSLLFTDQDLEYLRLSLPILEPQVEAILDVWYGFVGANPHLLHYFTNRHDGQPNAEYLARVRGRFGQWIKDTAAAEYDQHWLNYQFEIGRRHHRTGKNLTDGAPSVDHIHFRHLVALFFPITFTLKPFLAKGGHDPESVERMHQAWQKSVLLQTILWSHPYIKEGDF